jgi:hypothetical protein
LSNQEFDPLELNNEQGEVVRGELSVEDVSHGTGKVAEGLRENEGSILEDSNELDNNTETSELTRRESVIRLINNGVQKVILLKRHIFVIIIINYSFVQSL